MDRATNIQTDRASYIGAKAPLKDEGGNRRNISARYELQRGDNRKFETCLAEKKSVFFSMLAYYQSSHYVRGRLSVNR